MPYLQQTLRALENTGQGLNNLANLEIARRAQADQNRMQLAELEQKKIQQEEGGRLDILKLQNELSERRATAQDRATRLGLDINRDERDRARDTRDATKDANEIRLNTPGLFSVLYPQFLKDQGHNEKEIAIHVANMKAKFGDDYDMKTTLGNMDRTLQWLDEKVDRRAQLDLSRGIRDSAEARYAMEKQRDYIEKSVKYLEDNNIKPTDPRYISIQDMASKNGFMLVRGEKEITTDVQTADGLVKERVVVPTVGAYSKDDKLDRLLLKAQLNNQFETSSPTYKQSKDPAWRDSVVESYISDYNTVDTNTNRPLSEDEVFYRAIDKASGVERAPKPELPPNKRYVPPGTQGENGQGGGNAPPTWEPGQKERVRKLAELEQNQYSIPRTIAQSFDWGLIKPLGRVLNARVPIPRQLFPPQGNEGNETYIDITKPNRIYRGGSLENEKLLKQLESERPGKF
jgi:hypothetical protein